MWMLRFAWLVLVVGVVVGCGGRERGVPVEPPPPKLLAKAILEETAAEGQMTSVETLQEMLEAMKESDPAKADELLADYEELVTLTRPAKITAKAREMAGKL